MTKARDLANSADVFDTVTATELSYLDGVTSAIQTQVDSKLATTTASSTYAPLTSATLTTPVINNAVIKSPEERWTISATAATGTISFDVLTQGVLYYTSNATGNWTLSVRGDSTNTLNYILDVGDAVTIVFLNTNGGTAYYQTGFQIDGVSVTPEWQGGTAPSQGNANSNDAYTFTIVKTSATPTYTVLGSQTRFAQEDSMPLFGTTTLSSRAFGSRGKSGPVVTGGTLYSDSTYYYRYFSSNGTLSVTGGNITANVWIVGGGGGGGQGYAISGPFSDNSVSGGGGGAGGVKILNNTSITPGSYSITIGAGGAGGVTNNTTGSNGSGTTALGSGAAGGGFGASPGTPNGGSGGSGGGASGLYGGGGTGGSATSGEGNAGGLASNRNGIGSNQHAAAGGGGASAVGGNATGSGTGGAGGAGVTAGLWTVGGGGGGGYSGPGGSGGGGAGGYNPSGGGPGGNGSANTGGGGGGAYYSAPSYNHTAGTGGSGVVIVRYTKAQVD